MLRYTTRREDAAPATSCRIRDAICLIWGVCVGGGGGGESELGNHLPLVPDGRAAGVVEPGHADSGAGVRRWGETREPDEARRTADALTNRIANAASQTPFE